MKQNFKLSFFILLSLTFSDHVQAQVAEYKAVDTEFWYSVEKAIKDGNHSEVLSLAQDVIDSTKSDSLDNAEAQMAAAIGLQKTGFTYAATVVLADIIKKKLGTTVAAKAVETIEEIARTTPVDEDFVLGEIINDQEYDNLPPALNSFIGYQQGMFNLIRGYKKWSDLDFKKIQENSYWDFKKRYLTAIGEVARDRSEKALEKFKALAENDLTPEDIKTASKHQWARLIFEKGDYLEAYKIFRKVTLSPREKGLILMERAWSKYYLKDYSKALGLLSALEAPLFDTSRSPEAYILRMVIYNELCYYDAAFQAHSDFTERYKLSIKRIKARKDIRKDQQIVNLALLDWNLQKWVNLLNTLKDEREMLEEFNFKKYFFGKAIRRNYDLKITEVRDRLDLLLDDKSREIANQILDFQEQMTFLDYQTRLDSLRITKLSDITYKSEEIPHLTFDKIYWVSNGEYWLDELEDFKVFVESRCHSGLAP